MKKLVKSIHRKIHSNRNKVVNVIKETRGEIATNTIGSIIVAVVIVGLLILAINQFFPDFFQDMFNNMADKLNENW